MTISIWWLVGIVAVSLIVGGAIFIAMLVGTLNRLFPPSRFPRQ